MPSQKPDLPPLLTSTAATFPSEIRRTERSNSVSDLIKKEDLKTPITPPTAYTDFLKALNPALPTPVSATFLPTSQKQSSSNPTSGKSTPTSQPSTASSISTSSCACESHSQSARIQSPPATASAAPLSPFVKPSVGRTPTTLRRLRIPQSPLCSPATDSPKSSAVFSPFSPAEWNKDTMRYFDVPRSACSKPVSIRQVVTRTVTYKRTPLEPAPKGKRRKTSSE